MERKHSFRRRQKAPFAERAKEQCRQFTAFMFSNVGIIILVVVYMIGGAMMFEKIESDEASTKLSTTNTDMCYLRGNITSKLWTLTCCEMVNFNLNRTIYTIELDKIVHAYQKALVEAIRSGYTASNVTSTVGNKQSTKWSLTLALLFCLTVITTIGYGNVTPQTPVGKILTIFYAIIGMPLFLLYLSNIGDIFAKSFKWVYAKVCLCRICPGVARRRAIRAKRKRRARDMVMEGQIVDPDFYFGEDDISSISSTSSTTTPSVAPVAGQISNGVEVAVSSSSSSEEEEDINKVNVPITICLTIMIGYIGLGAFIFEIWEHWTVLDGCYFSFISLSSIGFGDIVPGMKRREGDTDMFDLKFILCVIYLLIGMALIAMCFNLMQEQVIHNIQACKRAMRVCFRCLRCNTCSSS